MYGGKTTNSGQRGGDEFCAAYLLPLRTSDVVTTSLILRTTHAHGCHKTTISFYRRNQEQWTKWYVILEF